MSLPQIITCQPESWKRNRSITIAMEYGSSPEAQIKIINGRAVINPIAGTFKRTGNDEEDRQQAQKLFADVKENSEHVMLVDLGRNDVRMVSKGGSVKVDDFMTVVKYSHVQHIESTVSGTLRDECDQHGAKGKEIGYKIDKDNAF